MGDPICIYDFFEGIEDQVAFAFTFDENNKIVAVGEPNYHLYNSSRYPFVLYAEELCSINQYCYEVAQFLTTQYDEAVKEVKKYEGLSGGSMANEFFTNYEMLMGSKHNVYARERIIWNAVSHLTVLLYSFLERAIKELYLDLFKKSAACLIPKTDKSNVKLYRYLECILDKDINALFDQDPDLFNVLEKARIFRNVSAHGNFKALEMGVGNAEIKTNPPFYLIEFLDTASSILDRIERRYETFNTIK